MKCAGTRLPCKWQLEIKLNINPDALGLVSVGGFSFKWEKICDNDNKAKALEFSWTTYLLLLLLVCSLKGLDNPQAPPVSALSAPF